MKLTSNELEILKTNSLSVANAQTLARQIESDVTIGGIFPNANTGDYSGPNVEKFKSKWCSWWGVARILLIIAKIFTGPIADEAIDKLLELGDTVCDS